MIAASFQRFCLGFGDVSRNLAGFNTHGSHDDLIVLARYLECTAPKAVTPGVLAPGERKLLRKRMDRRVVRGEEFGISPTGFETVASINLTWCVIQNPPGSDKSLKGHSISQTLAGRILGDDVPTFAVQKKSLLTVSEPALE